ncbi:hypothetical protein [Zavarzinella formosa]|uniref:hypothetical protein n=1 Tax=Zavarzinella formosa TaxID=360055 RepID=UPI0012F9AFA8|nr:hypothetical protein [Zavarzinella formosa]
MPVRETATPACRPLPGLGKASNAREAAGLRQTELEARIFKDMDNNRIAAATDMMEGSSAIFLVFPIPLRPHNIDIRFRFESTKQASTGVGIFIPGKGMARWSSRPGTRKCRT